MLHKAVNLEVLFWWPEYSKMGMRFKTWNVRSLQRSESLNTVVGELVKCRLHVIGAWEVRSDKGGIEPTEEYIFLYGTGNQSQQLQAGLIVLQRVISE
jgi:hypothetical protein